MKKRQALSRKTPGKAAGLYPNRNRRVYGGDDDSGLGAASLFVFALGTTTTLEIVSVDGRGPTTDGTIRIPSSESCDHGDVNRRPERLLPVEIVPIPCDQLTGNATQQTITVW